MFVWNPSDKPKHAVHTRAVENILWKEQYDIGVLQEAGLEKGFTGWKQLISNDRMTVMGHPNRVRSIIPVAERAIERETNGRRGVSYIQAVDVTFNSGTTIRIINTHIHCIVAKDFNKGPNGKMAPRKALTTVYDAMIDLMSTDKQTIFAGDFNQAGSHGVVSTHLRENLHARGQGRGVSTTSLQETACTRTTPTCATRSQMRLAPTSWSLTHSKLASGYQLQASTTWEFPHGHAFWSRRRTATSTVRSFDRHCLVQIQYCREDADESQAHYNARRQCAIMLPRYHTVAEDNEHHVMLVNLGIPSVHMAPADPTPMPDPTLEFNTQMNEIEDERRRRRHRKRGGRSDAGQDEDVQMGTTVTTMLKAWPPATRQLPAQ